MLEKLPPQPTSASRARLLRTRLSQIPKVVDPRRIREFLLLSQSQMGVRLGEVHPNGRNGKPYSSSAVCHFEHGDYAVQPETLEAYLIAFRLEIEKETEGVLSVKVDKRGRVTPLRRCGCGRWFTPQRWNIINCERCRK